MTHNAGPTWPNGLPQYVDDETIYYLYNPATDKYAAAGNTSIAPERLYVHFKFDLKRWVWASGADWRPITPNSKLQGKRIGFDSRATLSLDWYRLSDDWLTWKRVTDRERPVVYRWDADQQKPVVGETYPENWASLGGTLDPLPTGDKPGCQITLAAKSVKAKQPLGVHITIQGDVMDVEIEGQHPSIARPPHADAYAEVTLTPPAPGFYTATAKVTGSKGEATCSADYTVEIPETEPLKCELSVDDNRVLAGDAVVATLTSSGAKVTAVEIGGASIFNFLNRTDGSVTVQTRVAIRRQDADSSGNVDIVGAVHSANANATCHARVTIESSVPN